MDQSIRPYQGGLGYLRGPRSTMRLHRRGSGVPAGAQNSSQGQDKWAGVPEGAQITVNDTLKGTWGTCGGPECFSHWLIYPTTQVSPLDAPKFVPMGPWPIPRAPYLCPQSMTAALSKFFSPLQVPGSTLCMRCMCTFCSTSKRPNGCLSLRCTQRHL